MNRAQLMSCIREGERIRREEERLRQSEEQRQSKENYDDSIGPDILSILSDALAVPYATHNLFPDDYKFVRSID